jgi:hypothetical protein
LAACSFVLAFVASQPLLQAATLVLGPQYLAWETQGLAPRRTSFVPLAHLETLVWIQMAQCAQLLAFMAQELLQPSLAW